MTSFDLAGRLHGDLQKGFIHAAVGIRFQDLMGMRVSAVKED
jgi:hypothetical protein